MHRFVLGWYISLVDLVCKPSSRPQSNANMGCFFGTTKEVISLEQCALEALRNGRTFFSRVLLGSLDSPDTGHFGKDRSLKRTPLSDLELGCGPGKCLQATSAG